MSGGAWNFGASIMSFLFPEILFVVVACTLFVLYTTPEVVPGHRIGPVERPVSYTAVPQLPEASADQAATTDHTATAVDEQPVGEGSSAAGNADSGEAARTEDGA